MKTTCSNQPSNFPAKSGHAQQQTIAKHLGQMGVDVNIILKGNPISSNLSSEKKSCEKYETPIRKSLSKSEFPSQK